MSAPVRIFDRAVLVPGLHVGRRANAPISKGILLATGKRTLPLWRMATLGYDGYVATIKGHTHDATFVVDPEDGRLKIADALAGNVGKCVLTEIEEWEKGCLENGDKVIVGRPFGSSNAQLAAAAAWWVGHIAGKRYDKVALAALLRKAVLGDWIQYHVGNDRQFFCTEGVIHAYAKGAMIDPCWPEPNPTPGTMYRSYEDGRMVPEANALTEFGQRYALELKPA